MSVTTSNGTKLDPKGLTSVIDKMRDIQTEGDRWELAESLKVMIPQGSNGFTAVIDAATAEGVVGNLSANTLRLYRDTASRWPADKRVVNVSFSAHREAMVMESIDKASKMLSDLSKTLGPNKVTVASVRKAVAISQGKTPTAKQAAGNTASTKTVDALRDLESNGGAALIASITVNFDADRLDTLNAALLKVIAHVERLRVKAAQSKAKAKVSKAAPTPKAAPTNGAKPKAPTTKKVAGDMRGL